MVSALRNVSAEMGAMVRPGGISRRRKLVIYTISAAFAGQSATTTLTVTTATLNSIAVTPPSPTINLGASQLFAAQGTFSDGSVVNITVQVAWSSSDVTVATIKANGLASSASQGTTTIQATLNGVNGTAILTVQ